MIKKEYVGIKKLFLRYWKNYGGVKSIVASPYMHISLIITLLSYGIWLDNSWVEIPISVLPNVIGFSLGGYAIWLALGDDKFRSSISGKTKSGDDSPFMKVNAAFIHFIVLQILALLFALISKAEPLSSSPLALQNWFLDLTPWMLEFYLVLTYISNFLGYFVFTYAILSALAATMAIYRVAGWLEVYHANKKTEKKKP
jgi:hypothetical protein